ncbi:MAG TPA: hypothetical protein VG276_03745 [Actinomycetes bacterium]|nr:hypothetical protein [Actinomycetes bacterium]
MGAELLPAPLAGCCRCPGVSTTRWPGGASHPDAGRAVVGGDLQVDPGEGA